MKPLICPQCGGKITNYSPFQNFATCGYCSTRFLIEPEKQKTTIAGELYYDSLPTSKPTPNLFVFIIGGVVLFIGGIILFAVLMSAKKPEPKYNVYKTPNFPTPIPRVSPTPTPNPNLLEFGGKGTGNGLFKDADAIAVDKKGRIYVGDATLRVQQFSEKGEFIKLWQIPSKTVNYKRARYINKIAVGDNGKIYVAVGGVILIYDEESSEPVNTIHTAPDYIVDFALRSDGGLLYISNNDEIETLSFVNKDRKVMRRITGFHTETADAALSPRDTGLAAIRLAVDGAGNIFSVYAFGDLGSYSLSYNMEELLIFRFTPEGKYVDRFVQSMNSCGIEIDNQSRIYVSDQNSIKVYSSSGEPISIVPNLSGIDSFALDKQNNIYVLSGDGVFKRPAITVNNSNQ
jgi:sugar lactone lactonase YvrE